MKFPLFLGAAAFLIIGGGMIYLTYVKEPIMRDRCHRAEMKLRIMRDGYFCIDKDGFVKVVPK